MILKEKYMSNTWIKDKKTHNLVCIVYNPYDEAAKDILKWWLENEASSCYAYNVKVK